MFQIDHLHVGPGQVGLCEMPGRRALFADDWSDILAWSPHAILSLPEWHEMETTGADALPQAAQTAGIPWHHLPIVDYAGPDGASETEWPSLERALLYRLGKGEPVLIHCMGGIGRSGMITLRLMVRMGDEPQAALTRLRATRPGAVETDAQFAWATAVGGPKN